MARRPRGARDLILPDGMPWFMARLKRDAGTGCLLFQGATYRITRVTDHPQFPMIVLVVEPVD